MQTQSTAVPAGQGSTKRGRARTPQIAYTVAEFAQLLGKHPNTVYEWIRKGLVPYERIGSTYFIPERALGCLRPPATAPPLAAASHAGETA
jgi:excisionase family DNA binding protein